MSEKNTGAAPRGIVDLARPRLPLGPSPFALSTLRGVAKNLDSYGPVSGQRLARECASQHCVGASGLVADQTVDQLFERIYLANGAHGRILTWTSGGGPVERLRARLGVQVEYLPRNDDLSAALEHAGEGADPTTGLVYVTNPDDPTGHGMQMEELGVMCGMLPEGCLLVVDESYMDFTWPPERYSMLSMQHELPNLVILRGLNRCRDMAGLPSALGSCPPGLAARVADIPPAAPLTGLAENVALAALRDEEHHMANLEAVMACRKSLCGLLDSMDMAYVDSQAPFVLFVPSRPALTTARRLMDKGVRVGTFEGTELEDCLRVFFGSDEDMAVLQGALTEVLAEEDW